LIYLSIHLDINLYPHETVCHLSRHSFPENVGERRT
jgi:hypothetical protein